MLQRLGFPSIGPHRRFVAAICVDALGSGVFMPVSMLYFLVTTDLSLVQVGAAISLASAVALPTGPVVGSLVDRYGAKPVLLAGNLCQALGFAAYLVTDSFAALVGWTIVVTVGRTSFWGSYGNIVAAISVPGERERWFGFLGALRNLGFAVGGLVAGVAITIGTQAAYQGVVVANAASYLLAFALLLAVPPTARATHGPTPGAWSQVLRDRPYRWLLANQLAYSLTMMSLNFAMPVYAVTVLGLPGWVTGAVFTINTVICGVGQGVAVTAMTGRVRWRVLALTHLVFAASYVVILAARGVSVVPGIGLMLVGTIVYTVGEVLGGPVLGALSTEAAPDHLRGRYLSLIQLCWNVAGATAPVVFAWLLDRGSAPLWLGLAALGLAGAMASARLGAALPHAARPVTNRAEPVAA